MAEYLPVRAFNRSQKVRINKIKISPTKSTLIDISNAAVRKEFSYHSAIGAVYATGPVVGNNEAVVLYGLVASYKEAKKVKVTAGAYRKVGESAGPGISVAETTAEYAKPTEGKIIDLVELKVADGTIKVKEGTQSETAPTTPTADTGYIPLYTFTVAKNSEEGKEFTDVRPF